MFKEYLIPTGKDLTRHVECQEYVINRHCPAVLRHRAFQGVFQRYIVHRAVHFAGQSDSGLLYTERPETSMIVEHACVLRGFVQWASAAETPEGLRAIAPGMTTTAYYLAPWYSAGGAVSWHATCIWTTAMAMLTQQFRLTEGTADAGVLTEAGAVLTGARR